MPTVQLRPSGRSLPANSGEVTGAAEWGPQNLPASQAGAGLAAGMWPRTDSQGQAKLKWQAPQPGPGTPVRGTQSPKIQRVSIRCIDD